MTKWFQRLLVGCLTLAASCGGSTPVPDAGRVSGAVEPTVRPTVAQAAPTPAPTVARPTAMAVAPTPAPTATAIASISEVDPDPSDALPDDVVARLPVGYQLLGYTEGDLNLDGRPDVAVIIHTPGDADFGSTADEPSPRPVLLFIADDDGAFTLAARSDHVALCGRCGGTFGDPFSDLVITDGSISVGHYGGSAWRWTYTPTFAYDMVKDDWVLISIGSSSFHAADPENTLEDLSTTDVDPVLFADFQSSW